MSWHSALAEEIQARSAQHCGSTRSAASPARGPQLRLEAPKTVQVRRLTSRSDACFDEEQNLKKKSSIGPGDSGGNVVALWHLYTIVVTRHVQVLKVGGPPGIDHCTSNLSAPSRRLLGSRTSFASPTEKNTCRQMCQSDGHMLRSSRSASCLMLHVLFCALLSCQGEGILCVRVF